MRKSQSGCRPAAVRDAFGRQRGVRTRGCGVTSGCTDVLRDTGSARVSERPTRARTISGRDYHSLSRGFHNSL